MESAHPHLPRHNGGIEETVFIIDGRVVLQHLAVHDFCVDHGIPVNFASCVLEHVEVPVTVLPTRILPLGLFTGEDRTSHGRGARSLTERFFTLQRAASFERRRLATFGRRSGDDTSAM